MGARSERIVSVQLNRPNYQLQKLKNGLLDYPSAAVYNKITEGASEFISRRTENESRQQNP